MFTSIHRQWESICDDAKEIQSQNRCIRLLRGQLDAKEITGLIKRFSDAMSELTVSTYHYRLLDL